MIYRVILAFLSTSLMTGSLLTADQDAQPKAKPQSSQTTPVAPVATVSPVASDSESSTADKATEPVEDPNTYHVDPVHSTAIFRVMHQGVGMFYGRFNEIQGTIVFRPDDELPLKLDLSIPIESLDSGNSRLNADLKSPNFFDAESFPQMTFKSQSAKKMTESTFEVNGHLTIHDVTNPLTVTMELTGAREGRRGKRCGFEVMFTIKRSDFGMTAGVESGAVGDEIRIIIGLEAGTRSGRRSGQGRGQAGEGRQPGADGARRFAELLKEFDANSDGKLQKDEAPERMQRFFERIDANGDGAIDEEEMGAMRGRRGGRRGRGEGRGGPGGREGPL